MRYPFESPEARDLNKKIFETIYFASLTASCELAKRDGPYDTYQGSPVSKGVSYWQLVLDLEPFVHLPPFIPLNPSLPSTPTIFCRSCSLTCGEWLLLTSGIGLDSRLTLQGERKYCTLDGKSLLSWFSSHSIQVQLFLLLFIQLPLQLRSAQQPATGSHADCLHCPDPREQRVNWTLYQQHLH